MVEVTAHTAELIAALQGLVRDAGGSRRLVEPHRYPHLGLCIVDAVYSTHVDPDTVTVPVVQRYADACGLGWDNARRGDVPEHGAGAAAEFLEATDDSELRQLLTVNVAAGTVRLKFDVCREVARVLGDLGIDTVDDLWRHSDALWLVESRLVGIEGVDPATTTYMFDLAGVERAEPDAMVIRWMEEVLGTPVDREAAADELEAAVAILMTWDSHLSVRKVEHLVWRAASARPSGG